MDVRPADVSAGGPLLWRLSVLRVVEGRGVELGDGLPALGPAPLGGGAAADAHRGAIGRTTGGSRREGSLRLALAVRGRDGTLGHHGRAGEDAAGVSAARRILHDGRF